MKSFLDEQENIQIVTDGRITKLCGLEAEDMLSGEVRPDVPGTAPRFFPECAVMLDDADVRIQVFLANLSVWDE